MEHHVLMLEVVSLVNLINLVKVVEGLEVEQVLAVRWRPLFTYPGSGLDHGSTSCPVARRPRCLGRCLKTHRPRHTAVEAGKPARCSDQSLRSIISLKTDPDLLFPLEDLRFL